MMKQGIVKHMESANRTGDDVFHQSFIGATTNASNDYQPSQYNSMSKLTVYHLTKFIDKSVDAGDEAFQLPAINSGHKGSPFKGFLDISIVHQKLRKNMKSQDGTVDA